MEGPSFYIDLQGISHDTWAMQPIANNRGVCHAPICAVLQSMPLVYTRHRLMAGLEPTYPGYEPGAYQLATLCSLLVPFVCTRRIGGNAVLLKPGGPLSVRVCVWSMVLLSAPFSQAPFFLPAGIEPAIRGLSVHCDTTSLRMDCCWCLSNCQSTVIALYD